MRLDSLICSWWYEFVKKVSWVVGVYINEGYNCVFPLIRVTPVGAIGKQLLREESNPGRWNASYVVSTRLLTLNCELN